MKTSMRLTLVFFLSFCISLTSLRAEPLPSKAEVLAAIAVIEEKSPDSSADADVTKLLLYAVNSDNVTVMIASAITPWMTETGGLDDSAQVDRARNKLLSAYFAGNVKSQLTQKSKKPVDDLRAGWLTVIRVHEKFPAAMLGRFPSVERLAQLEKAGFLAEYAGIIKQENDSAKTAAQKTPASPKERLTRDHLSPAYKLVSEHKFKDAYAIYESWLAQNPDDADVHFDYAYALSLESSAAGSTKAANAAKKAARPHVLKAAVFGCDNPLLKSVLVSTDLNPKAARDKYSDNQKAHESIERAEKAFAQRRYDDAIKAYKQALTYEPKSYESTLYLGDCYYAKGDLADAIAWFEKAIALNPDRETAHRYMADALLKSGKPKEGLAKHIDALIAEPTNKLPRSMMQNIAQSINRLYKPSPINKLAMGSVSVDPETKGITLGVSPDQQSAYTMAYLIGRAHWITEKSAGYFPEGTKPRHCAAEEAAGLSLFSVTIFESNEKKDAEASNWLAAAETIRRLEAEGLLEAFIYIDRADPDIAKDYPAYREKHRDLLVRYIREFWFGEEPAKK